MNRRQQRRYWSDHGEYRAFYKYVCKLGAYGRLHCYTLQDGTKQHWRDPIDFNASHYRRGYPVMGYNSNLEMHWRFHNDEAYSVARDHAISAQTKREAQDTKVRFRREVRQQHRNDLRWRNLRDGFQAFYGSGLSFDQIPTPILKLAQQLYIVRQFIRSKQSKHGKESK